MELLSSLPCGPMPPSPPGLAGDTCGFSYSPFFLGPEVVGQEVGQVRVCVCMRVRGLLSCFKGFQAM